LIAAYSSSQVVFDLDDQMKIPFLRDEIRRSTEEEGIRVRYGICHFFLRYFHQNIPVPYIWMFFLISNLISLCW
jgi:hypothetical protein